MDMKKPFSKYFIASSHRTYLVEDQHGPASADGLANALKQNCRLIELDLWDPNELQGEKEPMVQGGPLSNNKLPLSNALQTISELAFEQTRFPLILHLSAQCSFEWQRVASKLIITHLGTKLYLPSADDINWNDGKTTPTPSDFQLKILIMV
ncbi:Phosphatidylinositol-specific phospholipase C, X domain protein [Dictyocaulus viviparus]|uniref:Phosphoinositide phospholipase C n=1 Tax=Dictyocaulus viviparus TaxID=29172 RepID=A0A0D8XX58_DICVI|nr:Phosphatidylinositol-specific phospholipase C, X domain protein [Dictyocaulus viviparus]